MDDNADANKENRDIIVTYETLYELSRLEKNREELQKLDPTFLADVAEYLKDKMELLENQRHKDSLFAFEEKESITRQIVNAKKLVKEIFERRERKIINMALNKVKSNIIIDTSNLLPEEKSFYENVIQMLQLNRFEVLDKVIRGEKPIVFEKIEPITEKTPEPVEPFGEEPELAVSNVMVKFNDRVDRFVGFNLEEYGPYSEGEVTSLPIDIASLLKEQGKVEFLKTD